MMYRRSRFEIYCDILDSIAQGRDNFTRIMHTTNISWPVARQSIQALENQGHLAIVGRKYGLTQSGYEIVRYYRSIKEKLPPIDEIQAVPPSQVEITDASCSTEEQVVFSQSPMLKDLRK